MINGVHNIIFVAFFTFELIVFLFTVVGNAIVIYVMAQKKNMKRKSNIYILSVAVADLLVGLVVIPLAGLNVSTESYDSDPQVFYLDS